MNDLTSSAGIARYRKASYGRNRSRHEAFYLDAKGQEVVIVSSIREKEARDAVKAHNKARADVLATCTVHRHTHPFTPASNAQNVARHHAPGSPMTSPPPAAPLQQADYDAFRKAVRAPSRRLKCLRCGKVRVLVDGSLCSRCNPTHPTRD